MEFTPLVRAGRQAGVALTAVTHADQDHRAQGVAHAGSFTSCSDEELLGRARAGEYPAFDELVARHRDGLYTLALGSLRDEAEAGEALCEMVLAAFHALETRSTNCSPGAWLWLHGLRVVLGRLGPPAGRYTIAAHPGTSVAPQAQ